MATTYALPNAIATMVGDLMPETVEVGPGGEPPVKRLDPNELRGVGMKIFHLFGRYVSDRRIAELRWLRNQRQYLGVYDPELEKELNVNRSKAYPRMTRVKCISVLSRIMNLMFPGDERNWELKASPSPDFTVQDVKDAIAKQQKKDQEAGVQSEMDTQYVMDAVQELANDRADELTLLIDDQLQELGGDQSYDYIALNRQVLQSGIVYGMGCLYGPYAVPKKKTVWSIGPDGQPSVTTKTVQMPKFEFMSIWDFYPDMAAKTLDQMDGHFVRKVVSRSQLRKLADRPDFMHDQITTYLTMNQTGNYRPQPFETELKAMGVRVNVNDVKVESSKYEIIIWRGMTSGTFLVNCGVDVPEDKIADEMDAEIWTIEEHVIKAALDPWASLGVDVDMLHTFLFDEDDTSPVGFGLPNALRDSQMCVSAATRMLMDNASVVCGPQLEVNTDLLRLDQDLGSTSAYKIWYRTGDGVEAQWPAVRDININAHLDDLKGIIEMFMKFADSESFVGPATGGDMEQMSSEPMRTAAGASMLRGDAALPFKDVVRNFDRFTQSVLQSLVQFNRKFNPSEAAEGDYDVIARGATSLMAKEVRAVQADQLAMTLKPEEMMHIDERKLVSIRLKSRDMNDVLVTENVAAQRKQQQDQAAQQQQAQQDKMLEANIRKLLSDAFKNIAQAQKNSAAADAQSVQTALMLLEQGLQGSIGGGGDQQQPAGGPAPGEGGGAPASGGAGPAGMGADDASGAGGMPPPTSQGPAGGMSPGDGGPAPGGGAGLQ